jgi:UDP-N-acetylglucosamine diphosphorylase/glucosamine-1-phosphate N-acetyltransferase
MPKIENLILFDDSNRDNLLPLTFTRPVSDIRVGITKIKEKWELLTRLECSNLTVDYLSKKFPLKYGHLNYYVNSSIIPDEQLLKNIEGLKAGEMLVFADIVIALLSNEHISFNEIHIGANFKKVGYSLEFKSIRNLWDIFSMNDVILRDDYLRLTQGRKSQAISSTNTIIGKENIFIEAGAKIEAAVINASTGPVYVGHDAEIMEGALVRGPVALCEHSALKMGAKIYGATTLGPHCKVGGEVNNSVFTGYSNKAHDGFLGNSVLGEWCNLGADSNNSNLKNNYATVKLYNYRASRFVDTKLQFCGLFMGDHSKCGINTMFNTGTIVGVSANIFGAGFPRNFIPSFSWGGAAGFMDYKVEKAIETAKIVLGRRDMVFSDEDKEIFQKVFELTEKYRTN